MRTLIARHFRARNQVIRPRNWEADIGVYALALAVISVLAKMAAV